MARSRKAKQWSGVLAEPIDDLETLMPEPFPLGSPECEEWLYRRARRRYQLRIAKLPELARQLGIPGDIPTTTGGRMVFYEYLALKLALKLEIPGFMEANRKWPREVIYWALLDADDERAAGERLHLAYYVELAQLLDSGLKRNNRAAIRRAKTLRNEISKLRRAMIKARAEAEHMKARAVQPSNIIKFHKIKPIIL